MQVRYQCHNVHNSQAPVPSEYEDGLVSADLEDHDSVYSYDDDCFAALSEHGDAAYADCGEERD